MPTSIRTLVERNDVDPAAIEDVIYGCIDTIGSQAGDIARTAADAAGLPESVPGVTIDRQCGSSQQAIHSRRPGRHERHDRPGHCGRVQKMSQYPILSSVFTVGEPHGAVDPWTGCEAGGACAMAWRRSAVPLGRDTADEFGLSREDMELFAFQSHQKAVTARDEGRFLAEIEPLPPRRQG